LPGINPNRVLVLKSMNTQLEKLLSGLEDLDTLDAQARRDLLVAAQQLAVASEQEVASLLDAIERATGHGATSDEATLSAADMAARDKLECALLDKVRAYVQTSETPLALQSLERIGKLYSHLASDSGSRHLLLAALAADARPEALAAFAELMATDPPTGIDEVVRAFVPLFQRQDYRPDPLFPRLFACLEQPDAAAAVLDLANYLTRRQMVARHPGTERLDQLAALLGGLVQRLDRLQESPEEFAKSPKELTHLVGEAVALIVPLCDVMALSGDPKVTGKLHQALELRHRRVRTEAAAALARLGDERGAETLLEMAAEPTVRTRALHYLQELGMLDRAAEEHRSDVARAEGDLAAWLAEPARFGMSPSSLELVDSCRQYWPGHDDQVDCYLFRYEFRQAPRAFTGVGIAGPVTHALFADLQDLPPADIYAAYAGWCAESDEIQETPAEELPPADQEFWKQIQGELARLGYEQLVLVKAGHFFGQRHWIATAKRENRPGVLVLADRQAFWYPVGGGPRPLTPTEVYYIHKGRDLLQTFNTR
jgi:hypothetical protein